MKWVKTQNGNIIRLGAVLEFILNEKSIQILIGETTEQGGTYSYNEQLDRVYHDLLHFITDADAETFTFPESDNNIWLKNYQISELNLPAREYKACLREGIKTVYDLMPSSDGWERVIYGISKKGLEELHEKRDEFVKNKLDEESHRSTVV